MSRTSLVVVLALASCKGAKDDSAGTATGPSSVASGPTSPANAAADEGPAPPQLWIEVERPTEDDIRALRFTADGRWLLSLDSEITLWDFDASTRSLQQRGWFGFAVDRERPDIGALTPENAFAVQETIERWKETHESVEDFELLPDGLVVGGGDEGSLALWRLQPALDPVAERIALVPAVCEAIWAVDVSNDGRWLLVSGQPTDDQKAAGPPAEKGTWEGIVQLWRIDASTLVPGARVLLEERPDEGLFTPDGRHVLVRASHGIFTLALDGAGGMRFVSGEPLERSLQDFALAPDGKTVVSGGSDHTVRTWTLRATDTDAKLELGRVFHHHRAKVRDVAIAPDGRWCLASSPEKVMSLWPLVGVAADEIVEPFAFTASDDYVHGIDIHPHGPWIASGGREVRIWRVNRELIVAGGARTKSVVVRRWIADESGSPAIAVRWSDEDSLVALAAEGTVARVRIDGERLAIDTSAPTSSRERTLAAAPFRDAFARGAAGALEIVANDGASRSPGAVEGDAVQSVTAAGDCIATGHASGRIATWTSTALVGDGPAPTPAFKSTSVVAMTRDASLAVVGGTDAEDRRVLRLVAIDPRTCTAIAIGEAARPKPTPSGDVLSSSSYPDGYGGLPRVAAFSPDGRWLATAEGDGAGAILWRVEAAARTLEQVGLLAGHGSGADAIAFAPDGAHVLTAGFDGEVVLHRLELTAEPPIATRVEYLPPGGDSWSSQALAWSPSGKRVAAGGGWGTHGHLWVFELNTTPRPE